MSKPIGGSSPLRLAALLALLAAASACTDSARPGGGQAGADSLGGPPENGGTAVLAELADINRPIPLLAESALDGDLGGDVMFPGLLRGSWKDGRLVYLTAAENPAALAWKWEYVGADSTAVRYHLTADRKWSDGEPVTSADVVWTYRMLKDSSVASPQQDYANHIDSVVANDPQTVTFHFDRRYPDMLFHSSLGIAPSHVFGNTPPDQVRNHPFMTDPVHRMVVSGPFRIGEWLKGQSVTLVPNPYFPVKPRLERIVIRVIPEPTTRLTELLTGNVDFMRPIPLDQVAHVRQTAPGVRFEVEGGRFYDYIGYNPQSYAPFADPEIRRALGLAIDVPGLIRALQMENHATPAGGPYSPIFKDLYDPALMPPLGFDTARASQILTSKGWIDHDGDGIRDKGGRPFSFNLQTNSGNARRSDVAQIVQQAWKRIGVDAKIQPVESNTFFDGLRAKNFQAVVAGWSIGLSADLTTLWGKGSAFNFVSYDDAQTFALFDQALQRPTEASADSLWRQAAGRIASSQPYSFLYFMDQLDGVNNRLRGMKVDTYGAYQNTWEWWIPASMQRRGAGAAAAPATARDSGRPATAPAAAAPADSQKK